MVIKKNHKEVYAFQKWWDEVGSSITPLINNDMAEHSMIIGLMAFKEALKTKWHEATERPDFDYHNFQNRVLVESSYGVRCAWFSTIDQCFQDCETDTDEDTMGINGKRFVVYRWQYLPEGKEESV